MRTAHVHTVRFTSHQWVLVEFDGPWARACRDVWNAALEERLNALHAARGRKMPRGWWPTYASQCRELTQAKKVAPWLAEPPTHVLQQTLKDLDKAWAAWLYEKRSGKPHWRAYKRAARNWWAPSYRFPDRQQFTIQRLNRRWGQAKLPKIGKVRFRWDRDLPDGSMVTNVTLKRDRVGDWTVVFAIDILDTEMPEHPNPASAVGVDVGVAAAVATSDGELADPGPLLRPGEAERLRRLEQKKSRQQRGSNNYAKTRRAIARIKRRERRRRADWQHKTSCTLADTFGTVAVEDLNVRNMMRSAAGTVDEPGEQVAAKRGLNRAIAAKGWAAFTTMLDYKTSRAGGQLVRVPAALTSQTCHRCGAIDKNSRENQAEFRCTRCGHACHADVNAAHNILVRATPTNEDTRRGMPQDVRCQPPETSSRLGGSANEEPAAGVLPQPPPSREVAHAA